MQCCSELPAAAARPLELSCMQCRIHSAGVQRRLTYLRAAGAQGNPNVFGPNAGPTQVPPDPATCAEI